MRKHLYVGGRTFWVPCLTVFGFLLACVPVQAVNVIKLDTASMTTNTANWSAVPATTDVGEFDATCSAGNLAALTLSATNLTLGGLQFDGSLAGPATILSGNTLTLGTSGINMANANQNVTINCGISIGGNQTWSGQSGVALMVGAISIGSTAYRLSITNTGSGGVSMGNFTSSQNDSSALTVSGGSFTGGGVTLQRTASVTTAPTATSGQNASTAYGFIVNGGSATATVSSISVGTGNSSASMLVSAGSLTSSGKVLVGKTTHASRWNICQVSGGAFTVNDTTDGIVLSQVNGTTANLSEFYLSGGTSTVGKISYGVSGDTLGGTGWVLVKGGSLYVGSGGVVLANASGVYNPNFALYSGLLGASADWSSSVNMQLSGPVGTPVTIQTADAAGVARTITLSGCLFGVGSINKTGGGKLVLAGTNTYAGSTAISAGTLQIGNGGTNGSLGAADAAAITNNGALAFKRSDSIIYSGVISGIGAVSQLGGGTLSLSGANTYTGGTTVSAGRLLVNNASGSGTGSGGVTVQGGLLGGTGTVSGAVSVNVGGGLAPGISVGVLTVGALTLNGGATNSFEFSATPANDQVFVATADGLVLDGGAFGLFAEDGVTPWTTPGTYNLIQFSGTLSGAATDGGGNLNSDWTATDAFNPHIANPQPGLAYAFGVSGGWLTLTITSDASVNKGVWTAGSDGDWSASGNWTAENGTMPPRNARDSATLGESTALRTVTLDANESVGTLNFNNANSFAVANGGYTLTLDKAGSDAAISVTAGATNQIRSAVALKDNVRVSVTNGAALYISGTVSNAAGSKALAVSGAGTLALSGNNAYGPAAGSVGTALSGGGVLQVGHGGALGTGDVSVVDAYTIRPGAASLAVGNAIGIAAGAVATVDSAGYSFTLNGLIAGGGSLTKVGAGTLVFNSTNVYAGGTVIGGGAVSLNTTFAGNGGLSSGTVTITNNARLALYSSDGNDPGDANASTFPNNIVVPNGATATIWNSARGSMSGTLTGGGTLNFRVNYWRGNISGNWSSFSGQVNVVARDTDDDWRFNNGNAGLPLASVSLSNNVSLYLYNHFYGSCAFPIGTLSGATGCVISSGSDVGGRICTYQVGARNEDSIFAGRIADSTGETALTKVGSGTLTLTGTNNTYTGATAVDAGTLQVDGAVASNVTVAAGASLSGSGIVGGVVTLASGDAAISLTNGVAATLTVNAGLTLNGGNVLALDVGAAADRIAMAGGNLIRNGTVTVRVHPLPGYVGRSFDLVTGIGITDASGFVLEGAPAEWKVRLVAKDGNLQLKNLAGTLVMVL